MGRPREHGDATRAALVAAAEDLIDEGGPDALSVRAVADAADTTTRAVYSLFGSKDGLIVAVAQQAFVYLARGLRRLRETSDPAADLVDVGSKMYRRFVRDHPAVFRLAFQRIAPELPLGPEFFDARDATWRLLERRFERLRDDGRLHGRTVTEAAVEFNAMCEGLGNAELRGGTMVRGDQERIWRDAFTALIAGLAADR
jgi:AcrR family transcriptional regulator